MSYATLKPIIGTFADHSKHLLIIPTTQEMTVHNGYHQMVSTEIRLIIFFGAEYGEVLYRQ